MNNPSFKTLSRIDFSPRPKSGTAPGHEAATIRAMLTHKYDPENIEAVADYARSCFNPPSYDELIMRAADHLIGGHGIEAIRCDGYHGNYWMDIHADYINTGDTYNMTLIHQYNGRYIVATLGDYIESMDRKRDGCRTL